MEQTGLAELIAGTTALDRLGEADDVADVVAFLASDAARWITGQVIDASDGLSSVHAPGRRLSTRIRYSMAVTARMAPVSRAEYRILVASGVEAIAWNRPQQVHLGLADPHHPHL